MKDIIPCPFCGHDTFSNMETDDFGGESWIIFCTNCNTSHGRFQTEQIAIDSWNNRTMHWIKLKKCSPKIGSKVIARDAKQKKYWITANCTVSDISYINECYSEFTYIT